MRHTMIDYKKYTYLVLVSILLILLPDVKAQNNTYSPFSMFGIGEIEIYDFGRTAGMGNIGIGFQSENFLNRRNPAALSRIDSLRFIVDVSAALKFSEFTTSLHNVQTNNFNFKSLAAGVRLSKKWTGSVGLKPYSNVGYNIKTQQYVQGTADSYENVLFKGSGGVNSFYWANAFEVFRGFSAGITASYLFGNISYDVESEAISRTTTHNISKIRFDFGLQYSHTFGDNTNVTVGGIYVPETKNIDIQRSEIITNYNVVEQNRRLPDLKTLLPETYGAGFSVIHNRSDAEWILAADYQFSNWAFVNNRASTSTFHFLPGNDSRAGEHVIVNNPDGRSRDSHLSYSDSHIYRVGLQLTPNTRRPENYFQIMRFQLGASYNRSYLKVNGYQMEDLSVSFGIGIPFTNQFRAMSYVNIAVIAGEMQTGQRGGITERYILLSLNASLIDRWFGKRQWD